MNRQEAVKYVKDNYNNRQLRVVKKSNRLTQKYNITYGDIWDKQPIKRKV